MVEARVTKENPAAPVSTSATQAEATFGAPAVSARETPKANAAATENLDALYGQTFEALSSLVGSLQKTISEK